MASAPRPRLLDHAQVAWVFVLTLLGLVPVLLWIPLSPVLRPLVRGRLRRRLRRFPRELQEPPPPDASVWAGRTVFIVAGEVSGDRMAAPVVEALLRRCPDLCVRGYAGAATAAAGAVLDRDLPSHAVVGVVAVVRGLGFWWRLCAETLARLRQEPPDVFFTVDFPGLNVRLARWARKRGVPTVHLVAPAVWAYFPWRTSRWRRAVDRLLATFPFEAVLLEGSGIPSTFVGHPLFEAPLPPPRTPATWPGDRPCTIDLLPGSRRQEIRAHAPVLLEAAALIGDRIPTARFVVRLAETAHVAIFEDAAVVARCRPAHLDVRTPDGEPADEAPLLGAVAASGTVTAELGAACVPMAIVYRLPWRARLGAYIYLTAPFIGLANLIAGTAVVPERLQVSARGAKVAQDFLAAAGTPAAWETTRARLDTLVRRRIAAHDVADRAARAVLYTADGPSPR